MTYFRSISFKLTFWVSLFVLVTVSIHLYMVRPERRFFEQKMNESERVACIIETHLLAEMAAGEPDNIQNHLELLPGHEGIHRVEIINTDMVVRFSSDKSRLGLTVSREAEAPCRDCHEQTAVPKRLVYNTAGTGRIFVVDHVLHNDFPCRKCHGDKGPILGNILVELSLTEYELAGLRARRQLLITGGALMIVMLLGMGTIIHFLIGVPAAGLLAKMNRIEAGDFKVGSIDHHSNEFAALDQGFNNMVEKLRSLYNEMEALIQERTNKLYETQAQVMHQEKLAGIGQLAAGVAHEIGNPLTAIDSMVQLLALESSDANVREKVTTIQRQVDRISEIVHNMADLSRPLSLDLQYVSVNLVVHAVLGLVKYDTRFREIETTTRLDESIPHVNAVEDRLFGVFLNVVLNAADAMPQGGSLDISTMREGDEIVIAFRDTGHGISEEHLTKIFDAYFTTKTPGVGTGLGLSVCKTFLQNLGGDIEVESAVGRGSVFRVRIPVEPDIESKEAL